MGDRIHTPSNRALRDSFSTQDAFYQSAVPVGGTARLIVRPDRAIQNADMQMRKRVDLRFGVGSFLQSLVFPVSFIAHDIGYVSPAEICRCYSNVKPERVPFTVRMKPLNAVRLKSQEDPTVSSSISQQGMRAACDRCRGQKLRCLRDNQGGSEKCNRCISAEAICSFSVSKRAGRPPSSVRFPAERREKRKSSLGEFSTTRATGARNESSRFNSNLKEDRYTYQAGDNANDMLLGRTFADRSMEVDTGPQTPKENPLEKSTSSSIREAENTLNQESLSFPVFSVLENATLPWNTDDITSLYDVGKFADLEPLSSGYDWPLSRNQTEPMDIGSNAISKDETPVQNNRLGEHTVSMHLRQLNVRMHGSMRTPEPLNVSLRNERQRPISSCSSSTPTSTSKKDIEGVGCSLPVKPLLAEEIIQRRRTQQLLELGMNLSSQLMFNEMHRSHAQEFSGLEDQCVGKVLKNSIAFLNILTSFYPRSRLPTECSGSTSKDEERSSSKVSDTSNPAIENDVRGEYLKPLPADMTTIVQLLSCYIRITHMHSVLYTRIFNYLTTQQHISQIPPVFPGLQVDGVSLDAFGKFQVRLVLQISTHILGEIEMALGLPEGYRIGKGNTQNQGILETSVSIQFVEMIMQENGRTGLGMEKDRVASIKDTLAKLRQLLKGAINI